MKIIELSFLDMVEDESIFKSDDTKNTAQEIFAGLHKGFIAPKEKELWVQHLRSNVANQARGHMCVVRKDGSLSFCILGVWVEKVAGFSLLPANTGSVYETTVNASEAARLIVEQLGHVQLEDYRENKKHNLKIILCLADINDAGISFSTLADIIEEYL